MKQELLGEDASPQGNSQHLFTVEDRLWHPLFCMHVIYWSIVLLGHADEQFNAIVIVTLWEPVPSYAANTNTSFAATAGVVNVILELKLCQIYGDSGRQSLSSSITFAATAGVVNVILELKLCLPLSP